MKKMNSTAVCISGQIRNDDTALRKNMENLSKIDADVFISVWKNRGTKTFDGANGPGHIARIFGHEIALALPPNWFGRMRDVFPRSSSIFPSLGDVTPETLLTYFPNAIIDIESEKIDFSFNHSDSNSLRMLYKIWRCNGLKRKAEKERGKAYDKVIRMRPDISLDFAKIQEVGIGKHELVVHGNNSGVDNFLQDIYWFGNSDVDNKMAKAVAHAIICQDTDWEGIHHELHYHTVRNSLNVTQCNHITGNINHYANSDREYDEQVRKNFVTAVKERQMDVDFAGGEEFCSVAEQVISAAYASMNKQPYDLQENSLVEQITNLARSSPKIASISLMLGASYFIGNRNAGFDLRFGLTLFYLKICAEKKLNLMFEKTLTATTEVFQGLEQEILNALVATNSAGELSMFDSLPVPDSWAQIAFPKEKETIERSAEATVYSQIMTNKMFCNWILQGIDIVGNERLIIEFSKNAQKFTKYNLQTFLIAAKACKSIGELEDEKAFLTFADALGDNWYISARLADISMNEGQIDDARKYVEKAMSYPYRQKWVVKLNDRINSVSD